MCICTYIYTYIYKQKVNAPWKDRSVHLSTGIIPIFSSMDFSRMYCERIWLLLNKNVIKIIHVVVDFFFFWCDKTLAKSNFGKSLFYLIILYFQEAGTGAESMMELCLLALLFGGTFSYYPATILIQPRTACQGCYGPQCNGFPVSIKEISHRHVHTPTWWKQPFNWGSFFSVASSFMLKADKN